jgi:hypothetical protein
MMLGAVYAMMVEPFLDRLGPGLDAADTGQQALGAKGGQRTRPGEREEHAV